MIKVHKYPFLKQIELDSFKLRLKVSELQHIDPEIHEHRLEIQAETGNIVDEFKTRAKAYEINRIKMRLAYKERDQSCSPPEDCVYILINSKQLGSKYFSGISWRTIKDIHGFLISNDIIKCSFDCFVKAKVTDMDFKRDYQMDLPRYISMLDTMKSITKPSPKLGSGYIDFNASMNKGIQFSKRESTSYNTAPFLKIYHKGLELMNTGEKGSNIFYNTFLHPMDVENIIRIEVTVKNKKHFESFKFKKHHKKKGGKIILDPEPEMKTNILCDILNLSLEEKSVIISEIAKTHLESVKNANKSKRQITPEEQRKVKLGYDSFMYGMVKLLYETGYSFTEIEKKAIDTQLPESTEGAKKLMSHNEKIARGRMKKKIREIISLYQELEQPITKDEVEMKYIASEYEILSDLRLVS